MKNFLMFDLMITPWIIRILYWISQVGVIIVFCFSLLYIAVGDDDIFEMNGLGSLLILIGGTLVLRLFFEMLMVQFKISENISQLKEIMKKNQSAQN